MTPSSNEAAACDLRVHPPRPWTAAIDGIVWLPRLIDKARACAAGTLGDYLYGQSPVDTSLLQAAGVDYATFLRVVRAAPDDFAVMAELDRRAPGSVARMRAWSGKPPLMCRAIFELVAADEGHASGPARFLRLIPQSVYGTLIPIMRRLRPFHADIG